MICSFVVYLFQLKKPTIDSELKNTHTHKTHFLIKLSKGPYIIFFGLIDTILVVTNKKKCLRVLLAAAAAATAAGGRVRGRVTKNWGGGIKKR